MEYRRLGSAGLQVSVFSFGAWVTFGEQMGEDVAYDCMAAAYEAGVNFFDNAEAYAGGKAETIMGKVFQRAGWRRSGCGSGHGRMVPRMRRIAGSRRRWPIACRPKAGRKSRRSGRPHPPAHRAG